MGAISGMRDGFCLGRIAKNDGSSSPRRSSPKRRIAALALAALAFGFGHSTSASSAVTIGGPFTLMASNGKPVTEWTYRGRWLLVYFGYTACPDSCPTALLDMADAMKALGTDAGKLQPIFITIDPQRDTRETLTDFATSFDPRIVALTGTPAEIDAVAKAYGAYVVRRQIGPGPQDYLIDHSVYIYLMGPDGAFIRAFDTRWSSAAMADAVRAAIAGGHTAPVPVSLQSRAGSATSASGRHP